MAHRPGGSDLRDNYANVADVSLVNIVASNVGAAGAGAQAELTRRFMDATRKSSRRLEFLTAVLVVLTLAILWLTWVLVQSE
jgi:hypothetical protein